MPSPTESINAYIRAKDQNRPYGMRRAFTSDAVLKMIVKTGRSWEPALAPSFIFKGGVKGFLYDTQMALRLVRRGRMPMTPSKIKRIKGFRRMLGRIIPLAGVE